ncbi:MAG TPA: ABC transporter ATP-binding protein [Reyranella sp.]|nr:ABC transporter ATP-binding protein [Reyranella sp.]
MSPEPVLAARGVGKRFGSLSALADVDLELRAGEVHCLLGENGAGKSTLCNLIFGLYRPDSGALLLGERSYSPRGPADALMSGIAMVHQHFSLVGELTVLENLCLGDGWRRFDRARERYRLTETAERFGIEVPFDALVSSLSVGERQRVEILKCLAREPEIVVLDEPTAVLPPGEIGALLDLIERMAATGKAILLVTHKLAEIARVADRITVLRRGRVTLQAAGRDVGRQELATAIVGEHVELEVTSRRERRVVRTQSGVAVPPAALMLDGVEVLDDLGVKRVENLTLIVAPGEIVGIAGVEGNGQTELGLALAGLTSFASGRYFAADIELTHAAPGAVSAAGVGIIPEDRHAIGGILGMTIDENIFLGALDRFRHGPFVDRKSMRRETQALIERFDIRCQGPHSTFASLSGGNQQKVVLAREITLNTRRLLVAAQPTRGLDIGATRATYGHIEQAARDGAGVLLISSELDDLLAICDRIVVLYRGRIIGEQTAGAYDRQALGALMSGHV